MHNDMTGRIAALGHTCETATAIAHDLAHLGYLHAASTWFERAEAASAEAFAMAANVTRHAVDRIPVGDHWGR